MRIDRFSFGKIIIDGKEYNTDVFITGNSVEEKESSHTITKDDIDKALIENPDIIIIGMGTTGMVRIPEEIRDIVAKNKIELVEGKTSQAIEDFNKLRGKNKIVAIFHLTC
ncbi:MAG: hypothetical protein JSV92_04660 [archaeon]|nr:MAG: hypothetical protein JSV92_04660 [archaeon]